MSQMTHWRPLTSTNFKRGTSENARLRRPARGLNLLASRSLHSLQGVPPPISGSKAVVLTTFMRSSLANQGLLQDLPNAAAARLIPHFYRKGNLDPDLSEIWTRRTNQGANCLCVRFSALHSNR